MKRSPEDLDKPIETPRPEGPTFSLADATTVGLSEEEHLELFRERNIGPYRIIRQIGQGGVSSTTRPEALR